MTNELSLIRFHTTNFYAVILNSRPFQPTSTILIKIVQSLIASEPQPDEINRKRIDWIHDNTHEKIKQSLPVIELAVFKNLDKGLNKEIEINGKTYQLAVLYRILDEISLELSTIVMKIAKKYSLDIPMTNSFIRSSPIDLEK